MNINSIKAETPLESFINVSHVDEETKKELNKLEKVLDDFRNLMDHQVRVGGLSINAYTIGGEAPLITGGNGVKVSAKTIYDDLDNLETKIKSLKSSIPSRARKHKLEEFEILRAKVSAKIKELEEEKKKKESASKTPSVANEIAQIEKQIEELKKKQATCNSKLKDYS